MLKLNKTFTLSILILFLVISILSIFLKVESNGLIYGLIGFVLLMNKDDIKLCDYIFVMSLALGLIIMFINIFIKNIYLSNAYSVYICALALYYFYKKSK